MRRLLRPFAASAVRERKLGAKPRLTIANAPFLRKTLREIMMRIAARLSPLKLRAADPKREIVGRFADGHRHAVDALVREPHGEVHPIDERARVHPRVGGVLVAG